MHTNSPDPMHELRQQFETETLAMTQRVTELITRQIESMENDFQELDRSWTKRHDELLELSEKTVRASAARLRQPVDETLTDLAGQVQQLTRQISEATGSLRPRLEGAVEQAAVKTQALVENGFAVIERHANETKGQYFLWAVLLGLGTLIGATITLTIYG